jgi:histidinol-phosphate aminotransferase
MTIEALVRSAVAVLRPYVAGTTVDQARRKYGLEQIIKLSSNENPMGSSPRAMAAVRNLTNLNIYVDDDYSVLRQKIATANGVPFDGVVLGHGSNEILSFLFATFLNAGDEVVMATPTFSLYRSNAFANSAIPVEIPSVNGAHDLPAMFAAITPKTKLMVICDPNNPTGTQVDRKAFAEFVAQLPDNIVLVLDQAYREYAENGVEGAEILRARPNTIVLRTASKVWGLAALRFGYAMTSPEIALPAIAAVEAALDDIEFLELSVNTNRSERLRLEKAFAGLGLSTYPSEANFLAVTVPSTATEAYDGLLQRGVIVRSGDGLSMPGYLRITIGTPEQNTILLAVMADFLAEHSAKHGQIA